MANLAKVARRAGVSLATASRVISNSPYGVTAELRERVLEAARELDYVPNAHARALVSSRTQTIGVVAQDVSDPYFSEVVRGVQHVADEADRLVTVCNTHRDPERELAYFRLLRSQMVEAILLASSGLEDEGHVKTMAAQIAAFQSSGGRVALIGRHSLVADNVVPENFKGARALGLELSRLGHRRFGVISSPTRLASTTDKLEGFKDALSEAGIELPPECVVEGDFTRDGGYESMRKLLGRVPDLTAVFAANDLMAVGALALLREKGVAVPEEVSVAGFNDFPIARDMVPSLTTVRLPLVEMGARAARLALRPREDGADGGPRVESLPTRLILRDSTGPAPKG
ncbi:LacI family DNA-binding transcriptional regulator [Rubrobacter tropicus]|uniref:LacI family DNA-binding transcriptional regulator n=1 Tax=Rubrobacter tropicus TaxID=2653851 RepID=A0A6G8Q5F6_9ACTN|nr:LacI family DNA-binding transcriptional regulator [Rubrobacter tropicus]QIN81557.1 LacI family DNA-binding transcriptional regulator [Rubrobacter tropicus]